jgi:hypothetical protein
VRVVDVELPDGVRIRHDVVRFPEARALVARGEVAEGFSLTSLFLFLAQEA